MLSHHTILIKVFIILTLLLFSCKEPIKKKDVKKENTNAPNTSINENFTFEYNFDTLKGIYIGDFGGSDIRLVLNFISNKHAVGYNIHKGLQRNVSGQVKISEKTIDIVLSEPGDNEFDGIFAIKINKEDFSINGYWKANDPKISKKYFNLEKLSNHKNNEEQEENVILNKYNFSDYFYQVMDSLGKISFSSDGLCTYKYYPNTDDTERKEQLVSFKGSWTLKNDELKIEWQKNSVFKNSKTSFDIIRNSEYLYDAILKGEQREFYINNY